MQLAQTNGPTNQPISMAQTNAMKLNEKKLLVLTQTKFDWDNMTDDDWINFDWDAYFEDLENQYGAEIEEEYGCEEGYELVEDGDYYWCVEKEDEEEE